MYVSYTILDIKDFYNLKFHKAEDLQGPFYIHTRAVYLSYAGVPSAASPLQRAGVQLGLVQILRGVGRRKQAGGVEGQTLVVAQVCTPRQAVLELQALEFLGQDGLTRAQVAVRLPELRRCHGGGVLICCL